MQEQSMLAEFLSNPIAIIAFSGWLVAQTIKVGIGVVQEKKFNFKWFAGTGGFPSSHTAGVTALTTSVGLFDGVGTALFVVALMFNIIVIIDSQGVRRATGQQAVILNKMVEDIYWKRHIQEDRLKELIGHTPFQTLAGMLLGLIVGFAGFYLLKV